MIAGALCFLIVLAAIGWGSHAIYQAGHPSTDPRGAPNPPKG